MITIKKGTKSDIPKIASLWGKMVNELQPTWAPDLEYWEKDEKALFDTGIYYLCIANDGDDPIGFVDGYVRYEAAVGDFIGYGYNFFILPEYRKKNIAYRLFNHIFKIAKRKGVETIELQAVPERLNDYKKMGFTTAQYVMRKEL